MRWPTICRLIRHQVEEPLRNDTKPSEEEAAIQVLQSLEKRQAWIHRRIETIDFRSDAVISRRVELHMSVPEELAVLTAGGGSVKLLPITLLSRDTNTPIELRDEAAQLLPVLTRTEVHSLLSAGLIAIAQTITGSPLDDASRNQLISIAENRDVASSVRQIEDPPPGGIVEKLTTHEVYGDIYRMLLYRVAHTWPLIALVTDSAGTRRIVAYSYSTHFKRKAPFINRLLADVGWAPVKMVFAVPEAETTAEYDFVLGVPDGMEIRDAILTARNPLGEPFSSMATQSSSQVQLSLLNIPIASQVQVLVALRVAGSRLAPFYWSILLVALSLAGSIPWVFYSWSTHQESAVVLTQAQIAATRKPTS
jgi:hypothetical protein